MQIDTIDSINLVKNFCYENFQDKCPFISFEFFELLEKTRCTINSKGWIPEHIVIKKRIKLLVLFLTLENLTLMVNLFLIKSLKMLSIKLAKIIFQNFFQQYPLLQ